MFIILFYKSNFIGNVAAQKLRARVVVLKIPRKLTCGCGSSFCNDGSCKTQISF